MLKAYIDESGHSSDPRCQFVGMGGLVAPSRQWERFTVEWQGTLDEFIGGVPFHMRDFICVPGVGAYAGWKENKRRAFFWRLVNATIGSNARYVGCVVSMEAFSKLLPAHQTIFRDPYYLCFQQVTHGCTMCGLDLERATPEDLFAGDEVAMVYALQEQFGAIESGNSRPQERGRAESLWHTMKATNRFFGKLMGW